MLTFLKALILLPVAVAVVLLAVANRAPVTLSFDPFSRGAPEITATVPLYAVLFGAVALGIVLGGVGAWVAQGRHRRAERRYKREVNQLRAETDRLRQTRPAPAGAGLPALTSSRA